MGKGGKMGLMITGWIEIWDREWGMGVGVR